MEYNWEGWNTIDNERTDKTEFQQTYLGAFTFFHIINGNVLPCTYLVLMRMEPQQSKPQVRTKHHLLWVVLTVRKVWKRCQQTNNSKNSDVSSPRNCLARSLFPTSWFPLELPEGRSATTMRKQIVVTDFLLFNAHFRCIHVCNVNHSVVLNISVVYACNLI